MNLKRIYTLLLILLTATANFAQVHVPEIPRERIEKKTEQTDRDKAANEAELHRPGFGVIKGRITVAFESMFALQHLKVPPQDLPQIEKTVKSVEQATYGKSREMAIQDANASFGRLPADMLYLTVDLLKDNQTAAACDVFNQSQQNAFKQHNLFDELDNTISSNLPNSYRLKEKMLTVIRLNSGVAKSAFATVRQEENSLAVQVDKLPAAAVNGKADVIKVFCQYAGPAVQDVQPSQQATASLAGIYLLPAGVEKPAAMLGTEYDYEAHRIAGANGDTSAITRPGNIIVAIGLPGGRAVTKTLNLRTVYVQVLPAKGVTAPANGKGRPCYIAYYQVGGPAKKTTHNG